MITILDLENPIDKIAVYCSTKEEVKQMVDFYARHTLLNADKPLKDIEDIGVLVFDHKSTMTGVMKYGTQDNYTDYLQITVNRFFEILEGKNETNEWERCFMLHLEEGDVLIRKEEINLLGLESDIETIKRAYAIYSKIIDKHNLEFNDVSAKVKE